MFGHTYFEHVPIFRLFIAKKGHFTQILYNFSHRGAPGVEKTALHYNWEGMKKVRPRHPFLRPCQRMIAQKSLFIIKTFEYWKVLITKKLFLLVR